LAKDIGSRQSTLLSNLRSALNLCHTFECWRSSRRLGDPNASPGRRASLQEVF
jgi:hypothetical protein